LIARLLDDEMVVGAAWIGAALFVGVADIEQS